MTIFPRLFTLTRKFSSLLALVLGIAVMPQQPAMAADQCTSTNNSTASATLSIGTLGALTASQLINGVLVTEGQISTMADRILFTELEIGAMANRIVYVTQFSQTNTIVAIFQITNLTYLGQVDGQYRYSGTLVQVLSKPAGW